MAYARQAWLLWQCAARAPPAHAPRYWALLRRAHGRPEEAGAAVTRRASDVVVQASGESTPLTPAYRLHFRDAVRNAIISPWHDVSLSAGHDAGPLYHLVIEIPRGETAKMEIATTEPGNPIKQDIKKGQLRQVLYKGGMPGNYGALPQTWEDPNEADPASGLKGDGDPLDAIELLAPARRVGEIVRVRIIGALALIDDGECDWKLLAVDADAPEQRLREPGDAPEAELAAIRTWFQLYKTLEGKPPNAYALGGRCVSAAEARDVIDRCHEAWCRLRAPGHMHPANAPRHLA